MIPTPRTSGRPRYANTNPDWRWEGGVFIPSQQGQFDRNPLRRVITVDNGDEVRRGTDYLGKTFDQKILATDKNTGKLKTRTQSETNISEFCLKCLFFPIFMECFMVSI